MKNVSEPPIITRLEVIDEDGRLIVLRDLTELKYDIQDNGRTLKIFVKGG